MKSFIVKFSIIFSLGIILFACETDEPPNINQDISGVWVLEELYSDTYQNETEVIYSADLPVYGEELEFLSEGIYVVNYNLDTAYNEQFIFAFAGYLLNLDTLDAFGQGYGTWESHINAFGDNILHFDRREEGLDSYMFVDEINENSLTMTMVVNHEYPDINIENFYYPAIYQATWDARLSNEYLDEGFAYEDGYGVGETIGYYDGYNATYAGEDIYIFNLFYGAHYADTFLEKYDPNLADIEFDIGFWDGYDNGLKNGESEANQHDNGKEKSVTLTYKFTRK